ncbi:MAG TPA: LysM domain-containing protein, partial [Aggregatilineales bacterium]|nr:LysM domain-containing protein [Aggregatilineales bacterium]
MLRMRVLILFILITGLVGVPAANAQSPSNCVNTVMVWDNDTIPGIASRHGVVASELATLNGLQVNSSLKIGQVLCMDGLIVAQPASGANTFGTGGPTTNTPATGNVTTDASSTAVDESDTTTDSSSDTTSEADETEEDAAATDTSAGTGSASGGQQEQTQQTVPVTPQIFWRGQAGNALPTGWRVYTVSIGDTLYSIAGRYGLPVQRIAEINNIVNQSIIFAGEALLIPPSSTEPAPIGGGNSSTGGSPAPASYIPVAGTIPIVSLPS